MFCDNFKKYRKLSGMTQEEVAKFLMVTPQAVSKWETGNGTPDISLLILIAELFCISTDELLGRTSMVMDNMLDEIYASGESYEERYNKYLELLKSNPNNEKILLKLLSLSAERLAFEKEKLSAAEKDDIVCAASNYAQRLQKEAACSILAETHGRLADVYIAIGDFRQAKEEIDRLPGNRYTKNRMLGNLALRENKLEESKEYYRKSVYDTVSFLFWDIERIAQCYGNAIQDDFKTNRAKMDEVYEIEYNIIHAIGTEGSPMLQTHLCNASIRLAQKAVWDGDYEKSLEYLDEFISNARALRRDIEETDTINSPILPKQAYKVGAVNKESILFRLSWNAFNPIRNDPRFQKYVKEIQNWS